MAVATSKPCKKQSIRCTTNESARTVIFIKPGTYKEKLNVPPEKKNLKLLGESYENTILTFDDYGGKTKDYASTRIRG